MRYLTTTLFLFLSFSIFAEDGFYYGDEIFVSSVRDNDTCPVLCEADIIRIKDGKKTVYKKVVCESPSGTCSEPASECFVRNIFRDREAKTTWDVRKLESEEDNKKVCDIRIDKIVGENFETIPFEALENEGVVIVWSATAGAEAVKDYCYIEREGASCTATIALPGGQTKDLKCEWAKEEDDEDEEDEDGEDDSDTERGPSSEDSKEKKYDPFGILRGNATEKYPPQLPNLIQVPRDYHPPYVTPGYY